MSQDRATFVELCGSDLGINIGDDVVSVRRLGLQSSAVPRKLLITFKSAESSLNALARAKQLRLSTDKYVAKSVFLNQDLTKEQARLAYLKRTERRGSRNPPPPSGTDGSAARSSDPLAVANSGQVVSTGYNQGGRSVDKTIVSRGGGRGGGGGGRLV